MSWLIEKLTRGCNGDGPTPSAATVCQRTKLKSLHHFNLTRQPFEVVPLLSWALHAQNTEPDFAHYRLDPIRLNAGGILRAKVEIVRNVLVVDQCTLVANVILARVRLTGLEFGAGLGIIDHACWGETERRDDSPKEQIDFTSRHNEADAGKNKLDASVCR